MRLPSSTCRASTLKIRPTDRQSTNSYSSMTSRNGNFLAAINIICRRSWRDLPATPTVSRAHVNPAEACYSTKDHHPSHLRKSRRQPWDYLLEQQLPLAFRQHWGTSSSVESWTLTSTPSYSRPWPATHRHLPLNNQPTTLQTAIRLETVGSSTVELQVTSQPIGQTTQTTRQFPQFSFKALCSMQLESGQFIYPYLR